MSLKQVIHQCYTRAMATNKKRINITVDDELLEALMQLKKLRQSPSLSAVVIDLAEEALELQEDLYFSKIADERMKEKNIPHDKFWKSLSKK
jgi:predicted DNA-binding protein